MGRGVKEISLRSHFGALEHASEAIEAMMAVSRWRAGPEMAAKMNRLRQMGVANADASGEWYLTTTAQAFCRMISGDAKTQLFQAAGNHRGLMERAEKLFEACDAELASGGGADLSGMLDEFIRSLDQIADTVVHEILGIENFVASELGAKETLALRIQQSNHVIEQGERLAEWLGGLHEWELRKKSQEGDLRADLAAALRLTIYRSDRLDRWRGQVRNGLASVRNQASAQRVIAERVLAFRSVARAFAENPGLGETLGVFSDAQAAAVFPPKPFALKSWVDVNDNNQRARWAPLAEAAAQKSSADPFAEKGESGVPLASAGAAKKAPPKRREHEDVFRQMLLAARQQAPRPLSLARWLSQRPAGAATAPKIDAWIAWALRPQPAQAPFKVHPVRGAKKSGLSAAPIVDAQIVFVGSARRSQPLAFAGQEGQNPPSQNPNRGPAGAIEGAKAGNAAQPQEASA